MKNIVGSIAIFLFLFLPACGAPADEYFEDDLGTLEQALTWPTGFGWQVSTNPAVNVKRCTDRSSQVCARPFDKKIYWGFMAGTCSSWWQTRAVEAWNDWTNVMDDLGWEYHDSTNGVQMKCGTISGTTFAQFEPVKVLQADGDYTFTKGLITIDTADIETQSIVGWSGHTDVQRQRFARNTILHEMFHESGLGHGGSDTLMSGWSGTWYTTLKGSTTEENNWMADFVP